jgi:aminodeoxyfutalosine synthase
MTVSVAELESLAASHDIITLGMLADEARRARHGTQTTFVRVADVTADPDAPIVIPPAAGEVRITGAPATAAAASARIRQVAAAAAGRVPISGFSLADLEELSARERLTLRALLEQMRADGLELIAEAPFDRLHDPRRSIEEVNISGLALARLTLHQLPSGDVRTLFGRIAALQHDVAVIRSFAPLPRRLNSAVPTTGYDDVKRVALARLFLDALPSIQVDWALYGPKLAQIALTMGADDLDGVSPLDEQGEGRRRAPLEEVRRNIAAAGYEPVERNGRFEPLDR